MSNPPAPSQRHVWRSGLSSGENRAACHNIRLDICVITLRICSATVQARLLEVITLAYHHNATLVNRGRLDRLAAVRGNPTAPESRPVELHVVRAARFHRVARRDLRPSSMQLPRESVPFARVPGQRAGRLTRGRHANGSRNLASEIAAVPSNSVALPAAGLIVNDHAIGATSLRSTEPNRCVRAHFQEGNVKSILPPC
jgi:hypothetical protein